MSAEKIELDGRSVENPAFCNHRRGKNWAAVVTGKNAANCERQFLRSSGEIVDLEGILPGDVLEFGGDYITSRGSRRPDRRWWLVHEISDDAMAYDPFPTLAKAMKAARMAPGEIR